MFDKIKFGFSALVGISLGVLIALPFFWFGTRHGVGVLKSNAEHSLKAVERRQQDMSDEALRLERMLEAKGYTKGREIFAKVELLRSRLAGTADVYEKIEVTQDLDRALLNVESAWAEAGKVSGRLRANFDWRNFGRNWEPLKRYLVDEEKVLTADVRYYDEVLEKNLVRFAIGHHSFGQAISAGLNFAKTKTGLYIRQGWRWVVYGAKWIWSKIKGKAPERPVALPKIEPPRDPIFIPLPVPYYITDAPVPEEDYHEVQFNRETTNMADVEVGQEKPVLEGRNAPDSYKPVAPHVQKTVDYR